MFGMVKGGGRKIPSRRLRRSPSASAPKPTCATLKSSLGEFVEVESGKRADRPELARALDACRKHKAKLVIAKLDRLSWNLAFIATLMDAGVEFIAVDNPHANKLTLHILAAAAEPSGKLFPSAPRRPLRRPGRAGRGSALQIQPAP